MNHWIAVGAVVQCLLQRCDAAERFGGPTQRIDSVDRLATGVHLSVAAQHSSGPFIAVWESIEHSLVKYRIAARLFDGNGNPSGPEFWVSHNLGSWAQELPAVAALTDGDFMVVWVSPYDVRGQRLAADGSEKKQAWGQAIKNFVDEPRGVVVAAMEGGGCVVAWQEDCGEDSCPVDAQILGPDGSKLSAVSGVAVVSTPQKGVFNTFAIARNGQGFMVAWAERADDDDMPDQVLVQRYNASGDKEGSQEAVGNKITTVLKVTLATGSDDKRFVLACSGMVIDGDQTPPVRMQVDGWVLEWDKADGIGPSFEVNDASQGSVAVLGNGGIVVASMYATLSTASAASTDTFVQRQQYDATGTAVQGTNKQLASGDTSSTLPGGVAGFGDSYVVAWTNTKQPDKGIYVKVFNRDEPLDVDDTKGSKGDKSNKKGSTSSEPRSSTGSDSGSNTGAIVGIVLGVLGGVVLLGAVGFIVHKNYGKTSQAAQQSFAFQTSVLEEELHNSGSPPAKQGHL